MNDYQARLIYGSEDRHAAAQNAALTGALKAFPRPQSHQQSSAAQNGRYSVAASSAASTAGTVASVSGTPTSHRPPLKPSKPPHLASSSSAGTAALLAHNKSQEALHNLQKLHQDASSHNLAVYQHAKARSASPSSVAALLAAARHSPHTMKTLQTHSPTTSQPPRLQAVSSEQLPPEQEMPVEGTVSNVREWLQQIENHQEPHHARRMSPRVSQVPSEASELPQNRIRPTIHVNTSTVKPVKIAQARDKGPEILSPRPVRAISVASSMEAASARASLKELTSSKKSDRASPQISNERGHKAQPETQAFRDAKSETEERPSLPVRPSNTPKRMPRAMTGQAIASKPKPMAPPPRRSRANTAKSGPSPSRRPRSSSDTRPPPKTARPKPTTLTSSPGPAQRPKSFVGHETSQHQKSPSRPEPAEMSFSTRRVTPHMTGDSLANAIVASSIASSRAPSPTKSVAPSLPPRRTSQPHLPFHNLRHKDISRTPSPSKTGAPKGMRTTLRKEPVSDDDGGIIEKRHRKFLIRKTPHKHHEGDRKRWRDEVMEHERKRYEGLWAANRGLHIARDVRASAGLDADAARGHVSSLVVADIWRRSRLPDHVLEEVWELVDTEHAGRLGRAEFVIGLWLIDQRLKGRKLPLTVQPSVWKSVKPVVQGIRIPSYNI